MRGTPSLGALSIVMVGLAGIAWFALELAPPRLGFDNTDSPAVSLQFLRAHPEIYPQAGAALMLLAIALTVASFVVFEALAPRSSGLALRSTSAFGLFSAAFFFMHGVLRFAAEPLLYIDGLDHDWGQAAYLVVQMVGIHGFAQAGVVALCLWVVGVSVIGVRANVIPLALGALAVIPAFRLVGLWLGPFVSMPDVLWIFSIAAIPGVMLWCLVLGLVLLRRRPGRSTPRDSPYPALPPPPLLW